MNHYIHHIPGRLRVKNPSIKNATRAKAAQELLQRLPGVNSTEVNTLTGSVVIHYEKDTVSSDAILDVLRLNGYVDSTASTGQSDAQGQFVLPTVSKVGEAFGKAVFGVLIEKALERSAVALLAAII
jgi:cation transport ATPase